MNSKLKIVLIAIVLYAISAGGSFFVFNKVLGAKKIIKTEVPVQKKDQGGRLAFDDSLPKTEPCPLNGAKYSVPQREWWEKHRPLGVMIENSQDSRPQSGISFADVVYEAMAEGGITRFLVIYYCQDAGIVGPVRSARTYYLDWISEYGEYPLYAHVGGANTPGPADALSQIESYGWQAYNDLNQFSIGFPTFWRDYERLGHPVATEHTMYSATDKLWKEAEERGLTNKDEEGTMWDETFVPYTFKDKPLTIGTAADSISFSFSQNFTSDYSVEWTYDKANNSYMRVNGGEKHTDKNTGKQLTAKNVVILFMRLSNANDGYEGNQHLLYGTKNTSGNALIFMDGKEIKGTWSKKGRTSRTVIKDASGREVQFNPGLIWFEILSTGSDVEVK